MQERKNETVKVLNIQNEIVAFLTQGGIPRSLADGFFADFNIYPIDGKFIVTVVNVEEGKVKIDFSYSSPGYTYHAETGPKNTMCEVKGGITLDNNKREYSGWMRPIDNAWEIGCTRDEHYTAHLYQKDDKFFKDYELHTSVRKDMTDINYTASKGQLIFDDVGIQMKSTSDSKSAVLHEASKLGGKTYNNFWGYFPTEQYHHETVRMDWRPDIIGTFVTKTVNKKQENMAFYRMLRGEYGTLANFRQSSNILNGFKDIPREEISEETLASETKSDSKEQQERFVELYIHGRKR